MKQAKVRSWDYSQENVHGFQSKLWPPGPPPMGPPVGDVGLSKGPGSPPGSSPGAGLGVPGGPGPQGSLVHWMSVMAEHLNTSHHHHHDVHAPGPYGPWNGEVRYHGPWNGEGKMTPSEHPPLPKGVHLEEADVGAMYGAPAGGGGGGPRSCSSSSSSPPAAATMLVVPQPLTASKAGGSSTPGLPGPTPTPSPAPPASSGASNGTGRKYQCKMCPQLFGSKADLQLHTQIHLREAKPYKCSQCSKAFANSSYLSQHTRIHLGIKPYRCEICQRKFTQLSHLQQHIRTHTGDKPYKCRHAGCSKAFSQLSNLQSHSRCHQTDKPYKCNSCYKCFTDEAGLLEHIPKHKESKHLKTHICQYCGKSYTQETYLAKHMQKHSERPDKRPPIIKSEMPSVPPPPTPSPAPQYWGAKSDQDSLLALTEATCLQGHYEPVKTSSSAFTPIQSASSMLPAMTTAPSRVASYLSYDSPLGFAPAPPPKGLPPPPQPPPPSELKAPPNSFPSQLISLHHIRNYAHQPPEHLLGLKDKSGVQ